MQTTRQDAEFEALRATIRERGTVRLILLPLSLALWAAAAIATTAAVALPIAALVPLLVLAAGFEAIYALHLNVERIGRYLQVFHEDRWEQTAMAFGAPLAGTGSDPLFAAFFGLATMCNFVPVLLAVPVRLELATIGGAHALFIVRLIVARQVAGRQRAADLERFRNIKDNDQRRTR